MAVASKTWTTSYGRYVRLRITAQEVEVDVPNNRSKVRVTGQIYYNGGTRATNAYPQTYTVTVNGSQIGRQTGITYNLASGGTRGLTTYTSGWINHNSNGAKSVTVRGHITDGAGDTGAISQSYALTTIARASTLSSFSMPNHLKPSTKTSFRLGISRKSSSFTHDIQLRDGSTVIASWTGQGTPSTLSLTTGQTNTLLNRMSSSTSRTMTLRVQTKSGSTNIGGALTRTATVRVHSSVTPNVSGLSVAIEGNSHAKNNVKRFVQNISRVSGSFTRSATGGASIRSSKLEIRRRSGGSDLQTINSNSGTFPRVVALNGQYQARGTATDSRGRSSNTGWVDLSNFNVLAYSTPQITEFSTNRKTGAETTVDIRRYGTFSGLSGSNVLTIRLQKRASGTTTWTNVVSDVTTTSNTFGATVPSTGNSVASSYEFRLYIVDQFGNSAEQISSVTTQRVVLDIHKNEGVGIGKIRERGVLDVDGETYIRGVLTAQIDSTGSALRVQSDLTNGHGYVGYFGSDNRRKGYVGFGATNNNNFNIANEHSSEGDIRFIPSSGRIRVNWDDVVASGSNSNGQWVKFYDGTQICWHRMSPSRGPNVAQGSVFHSDSTTWNFPLAFIAEASTTAWFTTASVVGTSWAGLGGGATSAIRSSFTVYRGSAHNSIPQVSCTAIGRWK